MELLKGRVFNIVAVFLVLMVLESIGYFVLP
jgi:hypothetical protein